MPVVPNGTVFTLRPFLRRFALAVACLAFLTSAAAEIYEAGVAAWRRPGVPSKLAILRRYGL